MRYQQKTKRTGIIGILFLITLWSPLQGATSVEGKTGKARIVADRPNTPLMLKEVTALRAESEHFILEWMEREITGEKSDPVIGLTNRPDLPLAYSLSQNYPNPFNPSTTISFEIPTIDGEKQSVALTIYDVRGRQVRTLIDKDLQPGSHTIAWDGRDDRGSKVPSGIYLYTLRAADRRFTRKMTILK